MANNIDQYAKVKLGVGNEFMGKEPLIFMKWCSRFWGMPLVAFFLEKVPFPLCSVVSKDVKKEKKSSLYPFRAIFVKWPV